MKPRTEEVPAGLSAWAARVAGLETPPRPLAGDAGRRRYFRLPGRGLLLLHGPDQAENLAWLRIGRQLWFQGLPLPRIYDCDLERGFFLLEDLGDQSLAGPPDHSRDYPLAVELLARLHREGLSGFNPAWAYQSRTYDRVTAETQEIGYFLNSCLLGYLKRPSLPRGVKKEAKALARLAASADEERVLMHRDYQARNLMLKDGELYLLDWQGARLGPAAYDLASLLNETPRFPLNPELREELTGQYIRLRGRGFKAKAFRRSLTVVGAVRMMQALGAYGRLSLSGKPAYAAFMPQVLERLREEFQTPPLAPFPILRELAGEAAGILENRN